MYKANMTSPAARTDSSSLPSLPKTKTMSADRSSTACYRYVALDMLAHATAHMHQEDSPGTLHFVVAFLLFDGRQNDVTFEMIKEEGGFPRLLELILERKDDDAGLHRMLLELLYEMSRIQRLRVEDLSQHYPQYHRPETSNKKQ